jgi:hypothetical protein
MSNRKQFPVPLLYHPLKRISPMIVVGLSKGGRTPNESDKHQDMRQKTQSCFIRDSSASWLRSVCGGFHNLFRFNCAPCHRHGVLTVTCLDECRCAAYLRHELSSLARTLGSWVPIPLKAWMSVCVYSVFVLGRGLAVGWSPIHGVLLIVLD